MIVLYNMTVLARVHRAGCRARGGRARQRAGRAVRRTCRFLLGSRPASRWHTAKFYSSKGKYIYRYTTSTLPLITVTSFYISHRGFYAATRPPGAPCDPGSPSQTLWVGGDRAWPPCPRSGRRRSTHCGVRRAVGGGKGASSSISSSYMTRSTSVFRAAREG